MKLITSAFFILASASAVSSAALKCEGIFSVARVERRQSLIEELKQSKVPAFLKATKVGPIPVVLVTTETLPALDRLMKTSIGLQTYLQPGPTHTDHALLRLAYTQVDWAMPDTRGGPPSELHRSGIAWRNVQEKLERAQRKTGEMKTTIEVAYVVTPSQRKDLEYWHRVRRSTMFAVLAEDFHGNLRPNVPNTVPEWVFEGCFNFCNGHTFPQLRWLMIDKLRSALGDHEPERFLLRADVRDLIKASRAELMKLNPNDYWWFHHRSLYETPALRAMFDRILETHSIHLDDDIARENLFNNLIAVNALDSASRVLRSLGVGQDNSARANLDNPKVAAILVYASAKEAARFRNATFTAGSHFENNGWGADALGTIPYPDQFPL